MAQAALFEQSISIEQIRAALECLDYDALTCAICGAIPMNSLTLYVNQDAERPVEFCEDCNPGLDDPEVAAIFTRKEGEQ